MIETLLFICCYRQLPIENLFKKLLFVVSIIVFFKKSLKISQLKPRSPTPVAAGHSEDLTHNVVPGGCGITN